MNDLGKSIAGWLAAFVAASILILSAYFLVAMLASAGVKL
jgi:dolichol kinase